MDAGSDVPKLALSALCLARLRTGSSEQRDAGVLLRVLPPAEPMRNCPPLCANFCARWSSWPMGLIGVTLEAIELGVAPTEATGDDFADLGVPLGVMPMARS